VASLTLAAPDSRRCEQLGCQPRSGRHRTPQAREAGYASYVHSAVLISLVLLLEACSRPVAPSAPSAPTAPATPAPAKAETGLRGGPPLATPGEHMQYKLSLQGVDLATYDLAIGDVTELAGKRAIVVQGHAKVSGFASFLATIDDRFTSWVDVSNGRPLRFQTDEYASGSKTDIEHAVIDLAARADDTIPVTFHVNETPVKNETQKASQPVVWDYNAFLLALRAWEAPAGSTLALEVFRSRYMWHVDVKIHGKEKRVTALGELPALRIDGTTYKVDRKGARDPGSEQRAFTMWISDDDGRVPLEIMATTDYGDLKMQIVDYQPGAGQRLRP
jgi:Protein of unknown function (DUF3108)